MRNYDASKGVAHGMQTKSDGAAPSESASLLSEEELELLRNHVFFIGGGTCSGKTTLAEKLCCGEEQVLTAMSGDESSSCSLIGERNLVIPPNPLTPSSPSSPSSRSTPPNPSTLPSSTARRLFSADDVLIECAGKAHADGSEAAVSALSADFEHRWMRDPSEQLSEMLDFYHDVFPYIAAELASFTARSAHVQPAHGFQVANIDEQVIVASEPVQPSSPLVIAEGIAFLPELLAQIGIPKDRCMFLMAEKQAHDLQYAQRDWVPLMLEGCSDPQAAFDRWMQRDELFSQHVREHCAHLGYVCQ